MSEEDIEYPGLTDCTIAIAKTLKKPAQEVVHALLLQASKLKSSSPSS